MGKARETSGGGAHADKGKKKSQALKQSIDDRDPPRPSQGGKGKGKSKAGMDATPVDEIDDVEIVDLSPKVKKRVRAKSGVSADAKGETITRTNAIA